MLLRRHGEELGLVGNWDPPWGCYFFLVVILLEDFVRYSKPYNGDYIIEYDGDYYSGHEIRK